MPRRSTRRASPSPSSAGSTRCRRRRISAWKAKLGGIEVSDAKRLRGLEEENAKLKRLLADAMLDSPKGRRDRPVDGLAEGRV